MQPAGRQVRPDLKKQLFDIVDEWVRLASRPFFLALRTADRQVFLASVAQQRVAVQGGEFLERAFDNVAGGSDGGFGAAMRAADGLGNDAVDDAQFLQVVSRDLHAGCRVLGAG